MIPDYLAALGATVRPEDDRTRVLYKEGGAIFPQIAPADLRPLINASMHTTVTHLTRNVTASGLNISARQIKEVSLNIVVSMLYIYNRWRTDDERYKDQPLVVTVEDLNSAQAQRHCWWYCEKAFGRDYVRYAAALTGMSLEEFARFQEGQYRYMDR